MWLFNASRTFRIAMKKYSRSRQQQRERMLQGRSNQNRTERDVDDWRGILIFTRSNRKNEWINRLWSDLSQWKELVNLSFSRRKFPDNASYFKSEIEDKDRETRTFCRSGAKCPHWSSYPLDIWSTFLVCSFCPQTIIASKSVIVYSVVKSRKWSTKWILPVMQRRWMKHDRMLCRVRQIWIDQANLIWIMDRTDELQKDTATLGPH